MQAKPDTDAYRDAHKAEERARVDRAIDTELSQKCQRIHRIESIMGVRVCLSTLKTYLPDIIGRPGAQ